MQKNTGVNWFYELDLELKNTVQALEDIQLLLADTVYDIDTICEFYNSCETEMQQFSEEIEPVNNLLNKIQELSGKFAKVDVLDKVISFCMAALACTFFTLFLYNALSLCVFIIATTIILGVAAGILAQGNDDDKQAALAFTKNLTDNLLHDTDDINQKVVLEQISQALDYKDYYEIVKQFRKILLDKYADFFAENQDEFYPEKYQSISLHVNTFLQEIFSFIHKNFPDGDIQELQEAKKAYLLKMFTEENVIESFIEDITLHNITDKQKQQRKFRKSINFSELDRLKLIQNINLGILGYFKHEFPDDEANINKIRDIRKQKERHIKDLETGHK